MTATATRPGHPRAAHVDALRVSVCLLLFPYHAARVYGSDPVYHVKASTTEWWADAIVAFIQPWAMPAFFALAGWSTMTALRRGASRSPLRARLARLVPPLVFGCLTLAPIIKYVERLGPLDMQAAGPRAARPLEMSFFEFLPYFYGRLNWFTWSHLWFLAYLLVFTLACWPLLASLARRGDTTSPHGRLREGSSRPMARAVAGVLWGPLVVFAATEVLLRPSWPDYQNLYGDWANIATYGGVFVCGGLLGAAPWDSETFARQGRWLLLAGVVATAACAASAGAPRDAFRGVAAWAVPAGVTCAFGLAGRTASAATRWLAGFHEAVLPIYVLHHAILVLVAWQVVKGNWPAVQGAVAIAGASFVITGLVYAWAVRPSPVLRRLLGMPGRPQGAT